MANESLNNEEEVVRIPGLYPSKAIKDIKNINDVICSIQSIYVNDINNYFAKLYDSWTSPKAQDFYEKIVDVVKNINNNLIDFNESTIDNLVASFNRIAPSHRESYISVAKGREPYCLLVK